MDYQLEQRYNELTNKLSVQFGEGIELEGILLIIGIQELGQGPRKYSKDEKMNLMHIAICTILEPFGIYEFDKNDDDGWPHYKKVKDVPNLSLKEQELLMKEAILNYFEVNKYV